VLRRRDPDLPAGSLASFGQGLQLLVHLLLLRICGPNAPIKAISLAAWGRPYTLLVVRFSSLTRAVVFSRLRRLLLSADLR